MTYDDSGVRLYQAGEVVPAGYYARVDDGSYHLVLLAQPGSLPPSFDGHVAFYRAASSPAPQPAHAAVEVPAVGAQSVEPAPMHAH